MSNPRPRNVRILVLGVAAILAWQTSLFLGFTNLDNKYRMQASTGRQEESRFVYFLYYMNLYPVASDTAQDYSQEGARRALEQHGSSLVTEVGHSSRFGDHGRTYLYLPYAWLRGDPTRLTVRPVHATIFILGLLLLYCACWSIGQPLLGACLVLFLGSNPFQLFEAYVNENVFSWPISVTILALAMHLPLFGRVRTAHFYPWVVACLMGAIAATVRQVRTEPVVTLMSCLAIYLSLPRRSWTIRLGVAGTMAASFVVGSLLWSSYFRSKILEADAVVGKAGGHVYPGPRDAHHMFWHPIWCGLGDFDTKYGYEWDDRDAAAFAHPHLVSEYRVTLPPYDPAHYSYAGVSWDGEGRFYVLPYELEHYNEIVRDKVMHDISHDPLWYLEILARRMKRTLTNVTPVSITLPGLRVPLEPTGLCFLFGLGLLLWFRHPVLLRLTLFTLPLTSPAILVYSGGGMTYYACHHLLAAGVLTFLVLRTISRVSHRRSHLRMTDPASPP